MARPFLDLGSSSKARSSERAQTFSAGWRALLGRYPDEESWEGGEVTIAWAGLEPRQHAAAISLGYDARTWDSAFYRAQQQREQMNAAGAAGQGDEMGVEP